MHRLSLLFLAVCLWATNSLAASKFPSVAEAEASLEAGNLDDIYLAFGAIKPKQHPEGDKKVAAILVQGAKLAAAKADWALVGGFAAKACELDPKNIEAWVSQADAAKQAQHGSQEAEALDAALKISPKNPSLLLRRATLAREQGQYDAAVALLKRIAPNAPESVPAKTLNAEIERIKAEAKEAQQPPTPPKSTRLDSPAGHTVTASAEADDALPGYAARNSEHFRITYSEGQRDFAQKAGYEQQCLDLLERAWAKVHGSLGECTSQPTEVVLYTRKEFEFHFGGRFGNSVLGFFAGKIRMNHADNIDESFFDTAVHEYTHAVIDSMAHGGQIPTWVHEGLARWVERTSAGKDPADRDERRLLQMAQAQQKMPTLSDLASRSFADFSGAMVSVAYEKSALAIDLITRNGAGLAGLERAIRNAKGGSFNAAFGTEFGRDRLAMLDGEIARSIE